MALVVRLRVFEFPAFTTVIGGLLELVGKAVNIPVWVAAVGALASTVVEPMVTVEVPLIEVEMSAPTVPVDIPGVPFPMPMLQSVLIGALSFVFFAEAELVFSAVVEAVTSEVLDAETGGTLFRFSC